MTTKEISQPSPAENFAPGQALAEGITLKQKISATSIGVTWLAEESGGEVSLLFLPAEVCADGHTIEEVRAQVTQNRKLVHPQVLKTHDFIEENGWAAISSDVVEAPTLATLLAQKEKHYFEVSEIQPWIAAICQTLDDAHRVNLLHRDLSPQNILVPKAGGILLANFGVSRIVLDSLGRKGIAGLDDHMAYMSPQQLDGELPARWDDIYALGVLIYELLTGKPPFHSGDLLPQIRKNVPPVITARRAELGIKGEPVPPQWEKIVAACLEKHTPQRPKSAREVGIKLGAGVTVSATAAPTAAAPVATTPAAPAPSAKEKPAARKESSTTVEDIVWNKPGKKAEGKAVAPKNLAHLLETVPDEKKEKPGFPIGKAFAFAALVVIAIVLISRFGPKHNVKQPAPVAVVTPAPTPFSPLAPIFTPTPVMHVQPPAAPSVSEKPAAPVVASASAAPTASPAAPLAPQPAASIPPGADAHMALEVLQKDLADKIKAGQQADAEVQQVQKALADKLASIELMKKTVADTEAVSKQRADAEAKAAADAEEAKKAAADKANLAGEASKAKQQSLDQLKDQQDSLQKAQAEIANLQKTITDKQAIASEVKAKSAATAEQIKQQQAALLQKPQPSPATGAASPSTVSAGASPGVLSLSGTDMTPLAPAAPEKNPAMLEQAEKMVLNQITWDKQQKTDVTFPSTPATTPAPAPSTLPGSAEAAGMYAANPKSQIDKTMTNSMGMKFAPVGNVLFGIWLVRVQDFQTFAKATNFKETAWLQPGFKQGPDHPVVNVTWNDAIAFCKWLTDKEQKEGLLAPGQTYRLPTDLEWSEAVGLSAETGKTPEKRDMDVPGVYPWGTQWPPPQGVGNYTGEETDSDVAIKGYDDGYSWTSPVGTFKPNKYGLYDMGGNAWEWCMDWWNDEHKTRVLRGASWYNGGLQLSLLSSCREYAKPDFTTDNYGFRVVIATDGKAKK